MRKCLQSRRVWPVRRRWIGSQRKRQLLFRYRLLAVICGLLIIVAVLDAQLRPLVKAYTVNQSKTIVTRAINEAVMRVLDEEEVQYSDLVSVDKNMDGDIISIESNIQKINRLKSELTNVVLDELEHQKMQTVRIPIGTLIGGDLFNGRGPNIAVKVSMTSTALTSMSSAFESAGINQTNHQIMMDIQLQLFPAVAGSRQTIDVETNVIVAETVLVGKVPDSFTDVNGDNRDIVGKIFDYGNQ